MVKGRIILLVISCTLLLITSIVERAVGLPVVTFLLFPILYAVLPEVERVLIFVCLTILLAILFLLTIPEAAICLFLPIIARRIEFVGNGFSWKLFNVTIFTIASISICAVFAGVPFSVGLSLYIGVSMFVVLLLLRRLQQRIGQMYHRSVTVFA